MFVICHSEYTTLFAARESERDAFRVLWRGRHSGDTRYVYPTELQSLPPFAQWLHAHVRRLRNEKFPVCRDLVRLSSPPSNIATSWNYMYAYGALYRCVGGVSDVPAHVTFDCGIARMISDTDGGIDVGILRQILMVDYTVLKPVLMKASWVSHVVEGRSAIKRDRHGFWTCRLGRKEDPAIKNPYVYPSHVSQVFFMGDQRNPEWKVVLAHEPRSKRIVGEKEQQIFGASGAPIHAEGMIPRAAIPRSRAATEAALPDLKVPYDQVEAINADIRAEQQVDAIYDDDQYEDEFYVLDHAP